MIKARSGDTLIIGLSSENIKRLQAGNPMHFQLAQLGINHDCVIVFGDTEQDVLNMFNIAGAEIAAKEDLQ